MSPDAQAIDVAQRLIDAANEHGAEVVMLAAMGWIFETMVLNGHDPLGTAANFVADWRALLSQKGAEDGNDARLIAWARGES